MNKHLLALIVAVAPLSATRAMAQETAPAATQARVSVAIVGEIANDGLYQLLPDETLSQLVKRAGKSDSTIAGISVRRSGVNIPIAAEVASKFVLREGDIVVVSKQLRRVTIIGAVKMPGSYDLPDEGSFLVRAAIALAGGFAMDAEKYVPDVRLLRQDENGKSKAWKSYVLPRDAEKLEASAPLQDGDVIHVSRVRKEIGYRLPPGFQLLNAS